MFYHFFREHPFNGGFTIACGLTQVMEFLCRFKMDSTDISYLASLEGNDGKALFESDFLKYLEKLEFCCDIDAVPEGNPVFPHEPLVRVKGPIIQGQIIESAILNIINFHSLIATKAARVVSATRGDPVLEFGLRRAQGIDGALSASWAAHVGGCAATSNVLAGKLFGIPVRGTHSHSWVMAFPSEEASFESCASAMPNNCVFLVDTYDSLEGVRHAVKVGKWLRDRGHEMVGIRLDSGDLLSLSIEARKILDESGFEEASILASSDLDEHHIEHLKKNGATICVWGVGTRLVTGHDHPALGGVYKLAAIRKHGKSWQYKLKLSEETSKATNPGILQIRRFYEKDKFSADMIYDEELGIRDPMTLVDTTSDANRQVISSDKKFTDLLIPVFRDGRAVHVPAAIDELRRHTETQLAKLKPAFRKLKSPKKYPIGLEAGLHELKMKMTKELRGSES